MPDPVASAEGPFGSVRGLYGFRLTTVAMAGLQPIARNIDTHRLPSGGANVWRVLSRNNYIPFQKRDH